MAIKKGIKLTTGADSLLDAKDTDDIFIAKVLGNSNTFQSGDEIDGGKGIDTLNIVLGNESGFAISAETTGVEVVSVRSQSNNGGDASAEGNSGDNNVSSYESEDGDADENTIDAQDMVGVKEFWNTDSRSDLVIEDVRIGGIDGAVKNSKKQIITENVTIGWKNTDPSSDGDKVDYHVFFSPESLRATEGKSFMSIEWMDVDSASKGGALLKEMPYSGFSFTMNGKEYKVTSDAIDKATGYPALLKAIKDAVKATPGLENISVTAGQGFTASDTEGSGPYKGVNILLTATDGSSMSAGANITPTGTVPSDSGLHTKTTFNVTPDFITSKVVLDNVGRESEAGNLVIGSMSTRSGVDKFKVDVLRTEGKNVETMGNWVSSMSSTNEKLQEVVIAKNDGAYLYLGKDAETTGNNLSIDRAIPTYVDTNGLKDVRVFDASIMTGDVKVGATLANTDGADKSDTSKKYKLSKLDSESMMIAQEKLTADQIAKDAYYDNDDTDGVDELKDGYAEGDGFVDFNYSTGKGNDTVNLVIDEECDVNINTGAGNDKIKLDVTVVLDGGRTYSGIKADGTDSTDLDALDAQIIIDAGAGSNEITLSKEITKIASSNDTIVINGSNKVYNFNLDSDSLDFSAYFVVNDGKEVDFTQSITISATSKEEKGWNSALSAKYFDTFTEESGTLKNDGGDLSKDGSIGLVTYTDLSKTASIDETKVAIEKFYAGDAKTEAVENHIVINSVDNKVYYAVDGAVSLVGTLNLYSDTTKAIAWSDLTAANFA